MSLHSGLVRFRWLEVYQQLTTGSFVSKARRRQLRAREVFTTFGMLMGTEWLAKAAHQTTSDAAPPSAGGFNVASLPTGRATLEDTIHLLDNLPGHYLGVSVPHLDGLIGVLADNHDPGVGRITQYPSHCVPVQTPLGGHETPPSSNSAAMAGGKKPPRARPKIVRTTSAVSGWISNFECRRPLSLTSTFPYP